MLDLVGFDCSDYRRSRAFYERALEPPGISVVMEIGPKEGVGYEGCGFGRSGKPSLLVATTNRGYLPWSWRRQTLE